MIGATPPAGALDRKALTFPPQGAKSGPADASSAKKRPRDPVRRAEKFELLRIAGRLLPEEGVAYCCRYARWQAGDGEGWAQIKLGELGASWAGLIACGSVWMCPICAAKIAAERREEVRTAIERAQAEGLAVYMATLTMPHHAFQECADLVSQVALSFRQVLAGAPWERAKARARFIGNVRSLELTHGANGWHPHLHVLLMIEGGADAEFRAADLGRFIFQRWSASIARAGFGECDEQAWQFERCATPDAAGDYVSKWGPDWELTHGHLKEGKRGGRSPWRILKDYADRGEPRDAALFIAYAEALKGRRQLTWTKGLKARFKIGELEDAELADREDADAKTIVEIHSEAVARLSRVPGAMARTLEALEQHGVDGLLKFLAACHVDGASIRVVEFPLRPPDGYERVKTMLGKKIADKVFAPHV